MSILRAVRFGAALACAFLLLHSAGSAAFTLPPPELDAAARAELRTLLATAKGAAKADTEGAWFRVAVFALDHAFSSIVPDATEDPDVTKALREACERLPALSLAAVAAHGAHPIVSDRFCAAVLRSPPGTRRAGRPDLRGSAEAAAEARDALARFGGRAGRAFLDIVKKGDTPAPGAGGAQRSVFAIRIVLSSSFDAASGVSPGMKAGIAAAAGPWADRFDVRPAWIGEGEEELAFAIDRLDGVVRPGVIVVASEGPAHAAALVHGLARGAIVVDARRPRIDLLPPALMEGPADTATTGASRVLSGELPFSGPGLGYPMSYSSASRTSPPWHYDAIFVVRPPGIERGRRLAQVVAVRPELKVVAIALPAAGGDLELARGFAGGMHALGRTVHVLSYEPGRRDFAPEAKRFVATGAKAILLAGPAGESSEWLAALSKFRARPLVLGSSELSPEGFHPQDRARLEGAIFVDEEWEDRDSTFARRVAQAVDQSEGVDGADVRRGFRMGFMLARAVLSGAWTPSALAREMQARSIPVGPGPATHPIVKFDESSAQPTWSVELPLKQVLDGRTVRRVAP